MDLKKYIEDAKRTESVDDTPIIEIDPLLFASTVQIMIAAGNILDQIKKNTFYQRPYNVDNLTMEFGNIVASLDGLKAAIMGDQTPQATGYNPRVFHSIVGISTEAVELLEALTAEEFDPVNFLEELGDLNWYEAIGIDAVNGDFDQVLITNIEKLRARYPEKFTTESANKRDLEKESDVLSDLGNDDVSDGC